MRQIFKNLPNFVNSRTMSLFTQILNPITGKSEWQSQTEDYDYHQEVARAAFADMLHDTERNQKYYSALQKTIKQLHDSGKEAHVLDIGTGTGILSMMAVKSGADTVTACEAFMPMAHCAEKIMSANGMGEKIKLIKKRSTEIEVGDGKDMNRRANVLVTEVLDTELIGEGAIGIYNHAHKHLLTEDCILIPSRATVFAQVVQSPLAVAWNRTKIIANLDGNILLETPDSINTCKGEAGVHDMQLSQLPMNQICPISKPVQIFDFNFSDPNGMATDRFNNLKLKSECQGSADMVLFWWSIDMDQEGEIVLSCAPYWAHPDFSDLSSRKESQLPIQNVIPWRDHWMQAVYYIPKPFNLQSQEEYILSSNHDEYSFWFDAWKAGEEERRVRRHACSCSLHMTYSRSRIGQMNQIIRNKKYMKFLEENIDKSSFVLSISDGSLLGLASAKLGAKSVTCFEPHRFSKTLIDSYIKQNNIENVCIVGNLDEVENLDQVTHVFAEPYFITSILPWDGFYFGTLLSKIKDRLGEQVKICPHSAKIIAVPVEFIDLQKIRAPLSICEGFDLTIFDQMVDTSSILADAVVEAQPLWEYPCRALAKETELLSVSFENFSKDKSCSGVLTIEENGLCNGIALWVDWNIDGSNNPKSIVTTGPSQPIIVGDYVQWDMFVRQGVHLIPEADIKAKQSNQIEWSVEFRPVSGEIKFNFKKV
ncbi:protein arginine N-methyltransferase 7 [Episyrphus balteatus]|uniref:protein arginine N-methyltransferase 7 n=1 Tax=Episyrphus balteatus TaxID=286459 RepID=UPI002485A085|nr:protein arginine N-methyltransferase 7 [Episyrphus balteatus]